MNDICTINTLRILQVADEIKVRLSGELAAVHGLSVNEFFLLMHLDQVALNRLSRVELAKRMHVSASTVTRMVAPMEKLGMLAREMDVRDARLAYVVLTDAGRTKLSESQTTFSKQASYIFKDRWNKSEQDRLAKLLYRLIGGSASNLT